MLLKSQGKAVRFEVSGRVPVFIGRHALGLDAIDSKMSRQHAEIWFERGVWLLRDLNSTNGTYVNGKRTTGLVELEVGDRIRCGRSDLVVADLQPVQRVEGQGWGSDPDDTAMAAGELSGLLEAANRDDAPSASAVAISVDAETSDAFDDSESPSATPGEPPLAVPARTEQPQAPRAAAIDFQAKPQPEIDPDADLISLFEAEGVNPRQPQPTGPKPASPALRAETVDTAESMRSPMPDEVVDDTPGFSESASQPVADPAEAADASADEYTGDGFIGVPAPTQPASQPAAEAPDELSPIDDSPKPATTPDNTASLVAASDESEFFDDSLPIEAAAAPAAPDGSGQARAFDEPPAEVPQAEVLNASESPASSTSDQDDDDMLKLGFKGNESPSRQIEIDDPGLRGETPGRFVVQDDLDLTADDASPGLAAIRTDDDSYADAATQEGPWATGERAALLGETITSVGRRSADLRYPGRAGGRGRQKLPMALVGTLVVVFAGSAWLYGAWKQGWISPPRVAGTEGATSDAPEQIETPGPTADGDLVALPSEQMADARKPSSNSPTRRIREPYAPAPQPRTDLAPTTTQPVAPTPSAEPAPAFDAFDNGLALPTAGNAGERDVALASSATAPRVGSAAELEAIIAEADAKRTASATPTAASTAATPPAEPARPLAAENPSKSFVWSGITIGNEDTVFTAPTEPTDTQAQAEFIDAAPQADAPAGVAVTAPAPKRDVAPRAAMIEADRHVAFLVDISGTMVDSMPQLRAHLANAIDRLSPDTAFTILLFRQGETIELPPAGLRLATASARTAAIRWLNDDLSSGAGAVQLGGKSDPTDALQTSLAYGASDLVILSDNTLGKRSKANGGDLGLLDLVEMIRDPKNLTFHTVQFNYADERQLLRSLAERFNGTYEFVEEVLDASPDGLEPLSVVDVLR